METNGSDKSDSESHDVIVEESNSDDELLGQPDKLVPKIMVPI